MDIAQVLIKNKPRTIIATLIVAELVALGLLWMSWTEPIESVPVAGDPATFKTPPRQKQALDLQFLNPRPLEYYRSPSVRNPLSGPAIYTPPPPPPRLPDPPRPPITRPQDPPPPPPEKIEIIYLGFIATPEGKQSALIDDKLKKKQIPIEPGMQLYEYTVYKFDEEHLTLQRSDGIIIELIKGTPTVIGEIRR